VLLVPICKLGSMAASTAEDHKNRGNELLKAGSTADAIEAYGEAIKADATVKVYWSNRSAARLKAGDADGALQDAEEAVRLAPSWAKARFRQAQALEVLGKCRESADACCIGASASCEADAAEVKQFGQLKDKMLGMAAFGLIEGWWHGSVSAALGGFDQEFQFNPAGNLATVVYGQEMEGTYSLKDVEAVDGVFKGGLDVSLNEQKVPYLFKVGDSDDLLHLCCPMKAPERPRFLDGPGLVSMRRGRLSADAAAALDSLTEGQKVLRYLEELADITESQTSASGSTAGADAACEKIMASTEKTMQADKVVGQQTNEEKEAKMGATQRMTALRLKYSGGIEDVAKQLISGEVKVGTAFPEDAKALERTLRSFKKLRNEA